LIKNTEVYTGGFGAEYGGRISAIIDITTREGNKSTDERIFEWRAIYGERIMLEGPLKKFKEGGSSISYVIDRQKSR
jgi:hypothetical protein